MTSCYLIDDPIPASTAIHGKLLADARALPGELQALFDRAARPFAEALGFYFRTI